MRKAQEAVRRFVRWVMWVTTAAAPQLGPC